MIPTDEPPPLSVFAAIALVTTDVTVSLVDSTDTIEVVGVIAVVLLVGTIEVVGMSVVVILVGTIEVVGVSVDMVVVGTVKVASRQEKTIDGSYYTYTNNGKL